MTRSARIQSKNPGDILQMGSKSAPPPVRRSQWRAICGFTDLANKRMMIQRRPMAVRMQLNADSPGKDPGIHQLQNTQTHNLFIVHAQVGGRSNGKFITLRRREGSQLCAFHKSVHYWRVIYAGRQVEYSGDLVGAPASRLPAPRRNR